MFPVPCRTLISSNDSISPVPDGIGMLPVCCWGTSRSCIYTSQGKSLATIFSSGVGPVCLQTKPFLTCPRISAWPLLTAPPPAFTIIRSCHWITSSFRLSSRLVQVTSPGSFYVQYFSKLHCSLESVAQVSYVFFLC